MLESQPELASQLRRVRGGYLKIQGTWMPYEVCLSSVKMPLSFGLTYFLLGCPTFGEKVMQTDTSEFFANFTL